MSMNNKLLRPRASGFNPKSISGLHAWYDASDASTITQATGVSSWADKSGNGRTCSQATGANQPTYVLAGQNGRNVIDFPSATYTMTTDGAVWALTSANTQFWSFQFPDTANNAGWYLYNSTVNKQRVLGLTTSTVQPLVIGNTNTGIFPVSRRWYILSIVWAGPSTSYRFNQSSGTTINPSATNSMGQTGQMYMCHSGSGTGLRGYIGEHISYDSQLSSDKVTSINNYLAKKWGATIV